MDYISPTQARDEFNRARRRAALQKALAALTRRSIRLLPYDEIREQLKFTGSAYRGIEEIPLDAIIGSVGRFQDFTRTFLPTNPNDAQRWADMRRYMAENGILAPIEVYKVGDAYFVLDGNHRVSVAREMGQTYISAYVTEIKTRVPLSRSDTPEQLINKACYAQFLEQTNLDDLRAGIDLRMTMCDQYDLLLGQIEVHRYFLWLENNRESAYPDVVVDWYDKAFLPVIQVIREQNLVEHFPGRTENDLYVLLTGHRIELEKQLGIQIDHPEAATDLLHTRRTRTRRSSRNMETK